MEAFISIALVAIFLLGLDAAALRWGADSRESMRDDLRR
jgi:hypothetical protein